MIGNSNFLTKKKFKEWQKAFGELKNVEDKHKFFAEGECDAILLTNLDTMEQFWYPMINGFRFHSGEDVPKFDTYEDAYVDAVRVRKEFQAKLNSDQNQETSKEDKDTSSSNPNDASVVSLSGASVNSIEQLVIAAAKYGFWYATNVQHHGMVPIGNILQWLASENLDSLFTREDMLELIRYCANSQTIFHEQFNEIAYWRNGTDLTVGTPEEILTNFLKQKEESK